MRSLLAMPVGHQPDWSAATAYVASLSDEALHELAPACSAILGKRVVLAVGEVRQCLHIGLAHVRAAWDRALLPNDRDNRERRVYGDAEVLMEPHPTERRTFLVCSVELLDHVGVLDVLGCAALAGPAEAVMQMAGHIIYRSLTVIPYVSSRRIICPLLLPARSDPRCCGWDRHLAYVELLRLRVQTWTPTRGVA